MPNADKKYDVFISYADADAPWVEGYLINVFDSAGIKFHDEAAFSLGVPRLVEFENAVKFSKYTLLILTPAYMADNFNQFVDLLAQSYGMETATWPVIPLILKPVTLPPRLAALTSLDLTSHDDLDAGINRLCKTLGTELPSEPPIPDCPYPGMVPFQEKDSDRFFGRDSEINEIISQLRLHPFITIIGPSGSGKSSLVFAGVIPKLRKSRQFGKGEWDVKTMRPGEKPLQALKTLLDTGEQAPAQTDAEIPSMWRTWGASSGSHTLIVIDQFEETFTVAGDEASAFETALLELIQNPNVYVLFTVRADFYGEMMASPLWGQIQAHRMEVPPMDENNLRQAILQPAEKVGVFVETALVERMLSDAAGEPGVLPLIQETLVMLWDDIERRFLPLRAYEALVLTRAAYGGPDRTGLQVALARRAEITLASLTDYEKNTSRRIFMRLVQFGEGRANTRRQQAVNKLMSAGDDPDQFEHVLQHLVESRLITITSDETNKTRQVDISHEALINGWPTLINWLNERRDAEQTRRRLEDKAAEWLRLGGGAGGLLDEYELLESEHWLSSPDATDLGASDTLTALVKKSRETLEAAERAEKERQERELAQAQTLAKTQQQRALIFGIGLVVSVILLILAGVFWGSARTQRNNAVDARNTAEAEALFRATQQKVAELARVEADSQRKTAEAEAISRATQEAIAKDQANQRATAQSNAEAAEKIAEQERDNAVLQSQIARSQEIAANAQLAFQSANQLPLSALLALESLDAMPNDQWNTSAEQVLRQALPILPVPVTQMEHTFEGIEEALPVYAIQFDASSTFIASGAHDYTARVWDAASGAELAQMDHYIQDDIFSYVLDVAFHPNGQRLAAANIDGRVVLWDIRTKTKIYEVEHAGAVTAVLFSPDGSLLASAGQDGTAQIWNAATGVNVSTINHNAPVNAIAFSPDGTLLASGGQDGLVVVWNTETQTEIARLNLTTGTVINPVYELAFSPTSTLLATGSEDGTVRMWNLSSQQEITRFNHQNRVMSVAFNPEGTMLASGSQDNTARLWNLTTNQAVGQLQHANYVTQVTFSPDGKWLATASEDFTARLWDTGTGQEIARAAHISPVRAIAFSPNGKLFASAAEDGFIKVWDVDKTISRGEIARIYQTNTIRDAVFSPDGSKLAIASDQDFTVGIWQSVTGMPLVQMNHPTQSMVNAVAFDGTGNIVAGTTQAGTTWLWDVSTGTPVLSITHGTDGAGYSLDFNTDGTRLAAGLDNVTAVVWDIPSGDVWADILLTNESPALGVDLSADGKLIAVASQDGLAQIWNIQEGGSFSPPNAIFSQNTGDFLANDVALSPDNQFLAAAADRFAWVWNISTGELVYKFTHRGDLNTAVFSPDGKWLATASSDFTARIWNLETGQELVQIPHAEKVISAAFSPDGKWLVTASGKTSHVWTLDQVGLLTNADLKTAVCGHLQENLSLENWQLYFGKEAPYHLTCENLPPGIGAAQQ